MVPVKFSGKTYFCPNKVLFWLYKLLALHHTSMKVLMIHATLIICGEELINDKEKICSRLIVCNHCIQGISILLKACGLIVDTFSHFNSGTPIILNPEALNQIFLYIHKQPEANNIVYLYEDLTRQNHFLTRHFLLTVTSGPDFWL